MKTDFSDLSALYLNCTLKPTPELSHTEGLIENSKAIMESQGVSVEVRDRSTSRSRTAFTPT